ncbi:MAG: glycosyltransferase [Candidatus Omnitrophica bacterium]|nr:glycosyltransferase [Candidatus Omnitrophota bacterium]
MTKILILTEGGRRIGFGHITRCSALYDALKRRGASPVLVVNADDSARALFRKKRHVIFDWIKERARLYSLLKGADVVIVDSYLAGPDLYNKISNRVKAAGYIDDNKRIKYPRGFVINGSIYADDLKYPRTGGVKYLLGTKYTPLRIEFRNVPSKNIRAKAESVMITFGGNDSQSIMQDVLRLLAKSYPEMKKTVIVGNGCKDLGGIRRAKDRCTELVYAPDAKTMKSVMLGSDIAISAGGQTLYELARTGVPTIAISIADNQLNNIKGWRKAGFIEYAGSWDGGGKVLPNILKCMTKLERRDSRSEKSSAGRAHMDGKGSLRIAEFILNTRNIYA